MPGNQAHTRLWLLIENCTTRLDLDFLLTFIISLQEPFIVCVCKPQNLWVLPGLCPPPHWCVFNTHHTPGCFSDGHKALIHGIFGVPSSLVMAVVPAHALLTLAVP